MYKRCFRNAMRMIVLWLYLSARWLFVRLVDNERLNDRTGRTDSRRAVVDGTHGLVKPLLHSLEDSSSLTMSCTRLACTGAFSVCAPICFLVKTTRFVNLSQASALTSSALLCGASEM